MPKADICFVKNTLEIVGIDTACFDTHVVVNIRNAAKSAHL